MQIERHVIRLSLWLVILFLKLLDLAKNIDLVFISKVLSNSVLVFLADQVMSRTCDPTPRVRFDVDLAMSVVLLSALVEKSDLEAIRDFVSALSLERGTLLPDQVLFHVHSAALLAVVAFTCLLH